MRFRARLSSGLAATVATLTLAAAAGPAYATPVGDDPGYQLHQGRVTSPTPLKIRNGTNTHSPVVGTFSAGTVIDIVCKEKGQRVGGWFGGNDLWYLVSSTGIERWVSAHYVDNIGPAPHVCSA